MNNIDKWQKIYELNGRLKAKLNSVKSRYDSIPKNLDPTELTDWRLCTAYIDWILDNVDHNASGDFRGHEILMVLEFYFDNLGYGAKSSSVKNFDQLLDLLSALRWKKANKSPCDKSINYLAWEIIDRIAENKEARKKHD